MEPFAVGSPNLSDEQELIWRSLGEFRDPTLASVLQEEWVFLMTSSWILSRLKRPFDAFVRSGANMLQLGVRRTLHLPPGLPVTLGHWGRAWVKWIAVGGSSATALAAPVMGVPISIVTGVFLLLDP